MSRVAAVALMSATSSWPLRVVLPLVHSQQVDEWDAPESAFLAYGRGTTLYFGNVGDVPASCRQRFEAHLASLKSICFLSFEAIFAAGWNVD